MRVRAWRDLCVYGGVSSNCLCETGVVVLEPNDVRRAAEWVVDTSSQMKDERWTISALDAWSPRRTLDHLVDAMLLYCGYVATRATERITPLRNGDLQAAPINLLSALRSASSMLVALLHAMPEDARAFHPSGSADRTGWIGMACTELPRPRLRHRHSNRCAYRTTR